MARLSISDAWDETRSFVLKETRLLAPLALALLFLPSVVAALAAPTKGAAGGNPMIGYSLLLLAAALVGLLGQIAIIRLALGHRERLGSSLQEAARRLPSYVAALLLFAVPVSIVLTLIGVAALMGLRSAGALTETTPNVIKSVVFLLFLLISTRFLLGMPVAAVESSNPLAIVRRGLKLSHGQTPRLIGAFLLFVCALLALDVSAIFVVGSLTRLALGPPEPWTVAALLIAVADAAVKATIGVFLTVFFARVYAQTVAARGVPDGRA